MTIWLQTAAVCLAYALGVWATYVFVFAGTTASKTLAMALAFVAAQGTVIAFLLSTLLIKRRVTDIRVKRAERVSPEIRSVLADHAAGGNCWLQLRTLHARHGGELEACLADFLRSVRGVGHDRLSEVAVNLGFAGRWAKQCKSRSVSVRRKAAGLIVEVQGEMSLKVLRSLENDPDETVRSDVFRFVLRMGDAADAERIFELVCYQRPITRALMIEELERHLPSLGHHAIPNALRSTDDVKVKRTLEMIAAWGKVMALPGVAQLLKHLNPGIRAQALRVLCYVVSDQDNRASILAGLQDPNEQVKAAAAFAAGRLNAEYAIPALKESLEHRSSKVALTAAFSLGEMGETGMKILDDALLTASGTAAAVALEAIEKVRIGRHGYARLQ